MRMVPIAFITLAALTAPVAAEPAAPVAVVLANFSYAPADLHLHAGQPVTIHFVNQGSGGHDFTAPEFFAAATMDAANRARVGGTKGRVSLDKGAGIDIVLTPRAGSYKVHCSHFMHTALGMTGSITVD